VCRRLASYADLTAKRTRTVGGIAVLLGLIGLALAQLGPPGRHLPLYDGVYVEDPYRYVNPPPGQQGSPESAQATFTVTGGTAPSVVVNTPENPPQIQLIANTGAFAVSAGTTTLSAAVAPVAPSSDQQATTIAGNVYSVSVTDQSGANVPVASSQTVAVVLRAPPTIGSASVARWDGTHWQTLSTSTFNQGDLYRAETSTLGDFVLLPGPTGPDFLFYLDVVTVAVFVGVALFILYRRRRSSRPLKAR
jgi:hypothetical protein